MQSGQPPGRKTWPLAQLQIQLHTIPLKSRRVSIQILQFQKRTGGVFAPGALAHSVLAFLYLEDRDFFASRALILAS